MPKRIEIISDTGSTTSPGGRTIVYNEINTGPRKFGPDGKLILSPPLPDLPPSLRQRCSKKELEKWDDDRVKFNEQFTLILRAIA
jgi:hypothetical protein